MEQDGEEVEEEEEVITLTSQELSRFTRARVGLLRVR